MKPLLANIDHITNGYAFANRSASSCLKITIVTTIRGLPIHNKNIILVKIE